jgi:hypothetical protein
MILRDLALCRCPWHGNTPLGSSTTHSHYKKMFIGGTLVAMVHPKPWLVYNILAHSIIGGKVIKNKS